MKRAVIFDMYGVLVHHNLFFNESEDSEMAKLVAELKNRGFTLILLSNIFIHRSQYFKRKYRFLELFDTLYFSSDTGLLKPNPRVYELVLRENNLKPEECIFFDDTQRNVAVAQELGIESYLYKSPEQVREVLGV